MPSRIPWPPKEGSWEAGYSRCVEQCEHFHLPNYHCKGGKVVWDVWQECSECSVQRCLYDCMEVFNCKTLNKRGDRFACYDAVNGLFKSMVSNCEKCYRGDQTYRSIQF
jgi:hypothetical protein